MAETAEERILDAFFHQRDCLGAAPSYRDLGRAFGIHHDTARRLVMPSLNGSASDTENGDGGDA